MTSLLETKELTKNYLGKQALCAVDVHLESGRILGLMGPNGSGKTTFLKILASLIKPSSGSFSVCGASRGPEVKGLVSFLPDRNTLYPWMRAIDAIAFYDDFFADFNRAKALEMLAFMKLEQNERVASMSKGMIEKLNLTLAFSREAKLFLLDEPLGGIDPVARERIVSTIIRTWSENSSIIISTHLVNDVERLFNDVAFLDKGRILLSGDAESLRAERGTSIDRLYIDIFGDR